MYHFFFISSLSLSLSVTNSVSEMSMENLNCIDSELEESFSFSCYDSISDDEEEESYIEIALEPTTPRHVNELEKEGEEELKLRVSISSKTLTPCPGEELLQDSSSSSTSSSSAGASLSSDSIVSSSSSSKWRNMVDLSNWINRLLKLLMMSTLKDSSEIINGGELRGRRPQFLTTHHTSSNWDTRKTSSSSSKVLKAIKGGGITKLFIKLKWVKVQSKLPFIKSNKGNKKHNSSNNNNRRFEESIGQPFNKWSTHQNHQQLKENKSYNNIKNSFRVPDINLDAIKGIIEAMMGSVSIAGRKDRQLKRNSCPNSTQSSPIHNGNGTPSKESKNLSYHYTRENSVQAAIAHCKSSLNR